MNNDIIGKNIRKYRELKGYSQEYMAHELDLTQGWWITANKRRFTHCNKSARGRL